MAKKNDKDSNKLLKFGGLFLGYKLLKERSKKNKAKNLGCFSSKDKSCPFKKLFKF